jgi:hypothetical protein
MRGVDMRRIGVPRGKRLDVAQIAPVCSASSTRSARRLITASTMLRRLLSFHRLIL